MVCLPNIGCRVKEEFLKKMQDLILDKELSTYVIFYSIREI